MRRSEIKRMVEMIDERTENGTLFFYTCPKFCKSIIKSPQKEKVFMMDFKNLVKSGSFYDAS